MGKKSSSSQQVVAPSPPPAPPSYTQTLSEYINSLPQLLSAEQQYGPDFAQLQFDLAKQFAPQYSTLLQGIESSLYPNTAQLQESIAGQALRGINEPLPNDLRQQYLSDFNAGIGGNVNAPIGVNTRNIGLMGLQKQWQDYYRDLGLSATGRLPLRQAGIPNTPDVMGALPNALSYTSSTYGPYAQATATQNMYLPLATQRSSGGGGFNTQGAVAGGFEGARAGSVFGPFGTILGGGLGALGGGYF